MFMPGRIESRPNPSRPGPILVTWLVDRFGLGDLRPRRLSLVERVIERIAPTVMPIRIRF